MDELISGLLEAVFEVVNENLLARYRGWFVFFAVIRFCFWFLLGWLVGYAILQSVLLGLLFGGAVGSACGILSIRSLAKRAQKLRNELS